MRSYALILSFLLILPVLAGCLPKGDKEEQAGQQGISQHEPDKGATKDEGAVIKDKYWTVIEMNGAHIQPSVLTMRINLDNTMWGRTPCNRIVSRAVLRGGHIIEIPNSIGSTRKACTNEAQQAVQEAYFKALPAAKKWNLKGGELLLADAKGKTLLRFREMEERAPHR
jgi:heat shock protein HslJ